MSGLLFLTGLLAVTIPAFAADDCRQPSRPSMPDGAKASMDAMLAGQKAVKAFQASNMEYMQCLEREYSAADSRAKKSRDADVQERSKADYARSIDAYNAAVSAEEDIASQFNVELRAYKAANR